MGVEVRKCGGGKCRWRPSASSHFRPSKRPSTPNERELVGKPGDHHATQRGGPNELAVLGSEHVLGGHVHAQPRHRLEAKGIRSQRNVDSPQLAHRYRPGTLAPLVPDRHHFDHVAASYLEAVEEEPSTEILLLSTDLFRRGFDLYRERRDKAWSLTDCISFVGGHTRAWDSGSPHGRRGLRAGGISRVAERISGPLSKPTAPGPQRGVRFLNVYRDNRPVMRVALRPTTGRTPPHPIG